MEEQYFDMLGQFKHIAKIKLFTELHRVRLPVLCPLSGPLQRRPPHVCGANVLCQKTFKRGASPQFFSKKIDIKIGMY